MSERFHVPEVGLADIVELTGAEAHHLARVRRIRRGESVHIFDGSGTLFSAIVLDIAERSVTLKIEERLQASCELPFSLTLACSPAKGERFRWLVEKATEVGVTRFIPIVTARSNEQARAARAEKMRRWVIEACKQCGRNVLMEVNDAITWRQFLDSVPSTALRFLADPRGLPLGSVMRGEITSDVVLAVGPEGGFTEEEIGESSARGWKPVSLGPRILRVETAVVAFVSRVVGDR
jgi:16S rRNA (uracil1498-N3)-methyltransferase